MRQTMLLIGLLPLSLALPRQANAQNVGINATGAAPNASAMLDVVSTTSGVLIPRMTAAQRLAIGTPVAGLLVYQTNASAPIPSNHFWYYDGTEWRPLFTDRTGWSIWGNAATNANNNFLGTTDAVAVRFRTDNTNRFELSATGELRAMANGSAGTPIYTWSGDPDVGLFRPGANMMGFATTGLERFRIPAANQVHAMAPGTAALPYYTWAADPNTGIWSGGADILGFSTAGVNRKRILNNGQVIVAQGVVAPVFTTDMFTARASAGLPFAINGYTTFAGATAVYGNTQSGASALASVQGEYQGSGTGSGVRGIYMGTNATNTRSGVHGIITSTQAGGAGVHGENTTLTGNTRMGVLGRYSAATAFGMGVIGLGFGGVIPVGNIDYGVVGWVANNTNYSGYFNGNHVVANGTKTASVGTSQGNQLLYVTELPEVWFEDIGTAELINGEAVVELDPMLLETIYVDETHPMHVFVQLQGDCNGVFVVPGTTGFRVQELQAGTSNVRFSYRVMAKRLHFQDHRFGHDPVWGAEDTRKYSSYAEPPPIDPAANLIFQERRRSASSNTPVPPHFITQKQLAEQEGPPENHRRATLE